MTAVDVYLRCALVIRRYGARPVLGADRVWAAFPAVDGARALGPVGQLYVDVAGRTVELRAVDPGACAPGAFERAHALRRALAERLRHAVPEDEGVEARALGRLIDAALAKRGALPKKEERFLAFGARSCA